MRFSVCPHDIVKQTHTWLEFATYLQRRLERPVTLQPVTDFEDFYREALPQAELAFVNPMDAWTLVHDRGFLPLGRTELYDEVVFITHPENRQATLQDLHGQTLAAVDRQFATYLGLYLLQEQGIQVAGVVFRPSWIQVVRVVAQGKVPFGLLYRDFYTDLSDLAKRQVHMFYESHTRLATHMMLLHPEHQHLREPLLATLLHMHEDPEGSALLQALRLGRWHPIQDLGSLARVLNVPVPGVEEGYT